MLYMKLCPYLSKEKEITGLQQTIEEDQTNIAALQRRIRELEAKIEELEEDLENERALRKRVRHKMATSSGSFESFKQID